MAESSWPTTAGGRAVNDVQWETMAKGFAADGIIGAPTDPAVVYADSTGMQVKIRASKDGLVRGRGWTSGAAEFTKAIGANASGSTRIDLVILRLTRSTWAVTVEVKAGTPGAGAPALTQDATGSGTGVWEIALAQVTITSGASTIAAANVVNVTRYVGPNYSGNRPKVITWTPSGANNWNNTAAPTSDTQTATGMVQSLRTTFDKQSPDTNMELGFLVSGYAGSAGKVTVGARIMGSGYTSTNFAINPHYFNYPVYVGVDYSAWLVTHVGQNAGVTSNPHGHNIGQHNHGVTLPNFHLQWGGVLHVPNLSPRTYTVQMFIFTNGVTYTADANDQLTLRIAEV